ncbi:restriction endonuclease subunit S [Methanolobus sp.]|uniref:restriction endonuclease subunit S n=1 Tax=Methanolobus sp. TaxID=1874737 RepID=UPI0025F681E6|nr:restriction endonuclease subunit S [Methanolobus sp.]
MGKEKLPDGWRWSTLKKECIINPRKPQLQVDDHQGTSFVPMEAVDGDRGIISEIKVVPFQKVKKGYTYFEENDVLFAKITPCMQNKKSVIARGLINKFGFGSTEFHVLRCKQHVIPEWIYYFVRNQQFINEAEGNFTGAVGQQRVPKSFLEDYPFIVPPISFQQKIVDHIDKEIFHCGQMKREIRKELETFEDLITSVYKTSFENGSFQKYPIASIGDVCMKVTDGTHHTPKYTNHGIPFISVKDIRPDKISFEGTRFISEDEHKQLIKRCNPKKGDVLYTKVGTTGIAKQIDTDREFSIFVSVALLKVDNNKIKPEYLEKVLNSPICRQQAVHYTEGAGNKNLVIRNLVKIKLPLPPLDEQTITIDRLNEKLNILYDVRGKLIEKETAITLLPASILNEVFGKYEIPEKV